MHSLADHPPSQPPAHAWLTPRASTVGRLWFAWMPRCGPGPPRPAGRPAPPAGTGEGV